MNDTQLKQIAIAEAADGFFAQVIAAQKAKEEAEKADVLLQMFASVIRSMAADEAIPIDTVKETRNIDVRDRAAKIGGVDISVTDYDLTAEEQTTQDIVSGNAFRREDAARQAKKMRKAFQAALSIGSTAATGGATAPAAMVALVGIAMEFQGDRGADVMIGGVTDLAELYARYEKIGNDDINAEADPSAE